MSAGWLARHIEIQHPSFQFAATQAFDQIEVDDSLLHLDHLFSSDNEGDGNAIELTPDTYERPEVCAEPENMTPEAAGSHANNEFANEMKKNYEVEQSGLSNPARVIVPQSKPAIEMFKDAGLAAPLAIDTEPVGIGVLYEQNDLKEHPFSPFISEEAFNFAKWLVDCEVPVKAIDSLFNGSKGPMPDLGSVKKSFSSAYQLQNLIDKMPDGLGWQSWNRNITDLAWSDDHPEPITFYSRNVCEIGKWLIRQPVFGTNMSYAPVRKYVGGVRVYDEMNTGDWWWETQVFLQFLFTLSSVN